VSKILCATRGGEASYHAQDAAIALAKEHDDMLVFLYVVDLHFLDKTASAVVVNVESEVARMGEFLLLMAQERAAEQGVVAETTCRTGRVRDELKQIASEEDISLIVLGRPTGTQSVFEMAELRAFAAALESETGVETRIV
jgi:nucleotide-binding universal stress UspA family protein